MASFATPGELAAELQYDSVDTFTAQQNLDEATGLIRLFCGWPITKVTDDVAKLTGASDGSPLLFLPSLYVTSVSSVVAGGITLDPTTYVVSQSGLLTLVAPQAWKVNDPTLYLPAFYHSTHPYRWPTAPDSITVTFTHGYATVPAEIKAVCLSLAVRLYANPENVISESIGNYAVRKEPSRGGAVLLNDMEAHAINGYRLPPRQ